MEFEKKQKQAQVFSIKSLYERAIGHFPFDVDIWDSYVAFLVISFKFKNSWLVYEWKMLLSALLKGQLDIVIGNRKYGFII